MLPECLTLDDLAMTLKVSLRTAQRLVADRQIAYLKIGGRVRITPEAVEEFKRSRTIAKR